MIIIIIFTSNIIVVIQLFADIQYTCWMKAFAKDADTMMNVFLSYLAQSSTLPR